MSAKRGAATPTKTPKRAKVEPKLEAGDDSSTDMDTTGGVAAGTLKYRKYRERQRTKVLNMETELEELRNENAELLKRESKLMYLLLMSSKRENELNKVQKERDELLVRLGLEVRYSQTLVGVIDMLKANGFTMDSQGASSAAAGASAVTGTASATTTSAHAPLPDLASQGTDSSQPPLPTRFSHINSFNSAAAPTAGTSYSFTSRLQPGGANLSFSQLLNGQISDEFVDRVLSDTKFSMARDHFLDAITNEEKARAQQPPSRLTADVFGEANRRSMRYEPSSSDDLLSQSEHSLSASLLSAVSLSERARHQAREAAAAKEAAVTLARVGTTPPGSVILGTSRPEEHSDESDSETEAIPPLEAENGFASRFKSTRNRQGGAAQSRR